MERAESFYADPRVVMRTRATITQILFVLLAISIPALAQENNDDQVSIEDMVVTAPSFESQLADGTLTPFDEVWHSDLGGIVKEYFAARRSREPRKLRKSGLVSNRSHVKKLLSRWSGASVVPEDSPFALRFVAADGVLGVTIYTRVEVRGRVEVYRLVLNRENRRWILQDCMSRVQYPGTFCRIV